MRNGGQERQPGAGKEFAKQGPLWETFAKCRKRGPGLDEEGTMITLYGEKDLRKPEKRKRYLCCLEPLWETSVTGILSMVHLAMQRINEKKGESK